MTTEASRACRVCAALFAVALFFCSPAHAAAVQGDSSGPDAHSLAFTPAEMLRFDIGQWLEQEAPHLAELEAPIGHWAAYYHISPRVLITLMELESGLVSQPLTEARLAEPFGALSAKQGFREQLQDVAKRLSHHNFPFDEQTLKALPIEARDRGLSALAELYGHRTDSGATTALVEYEQLHDRFFGNLKVRKPRQEQATQAQGPQGSAPIDFQFPWPVGEAWAGGGAHSSSMQSLDFIQRYLDWGDEGVFDAWVSAAHSGRMRIWSECSLSIIDDSETWVTNYYHLENIQVPDNSRVSQNQVLANYADDHATAICQGGSSTGPHLHFSIAEDDSWEPIHGRVLSSFRINMESQLWYDSDCDVNWYEPLDGSPKVCPWYPLMNDGAPSAPTYQLDVVAGTGGGEFASGARVLVQAETAPPGQVFKRWTGDWRQLENRNAPVTTVTMGNDNVSVRATFENDTPDGRVVQLVLVNANNGRTLHDLDDLEVSLDNLPNNLSVQALVNRDDAVDRVEFEWRGDIIEERSAPFFLGGDRNGDPNTVSNLRRSGTRTLKATPYNPDGSRGETVTARFTFEAPRSLPSPTPDPSPSPSPTNNPCGHGDEQTGDLDGDGIPDQCDSEAAAFTGSWYDPDTSGEGLMVHAVSEDLAVAYFYGYDRDGNHLWLLGTSEGPFDWDRGARFEVVQAHGGRFSNFDADDVRRHDWGAFTLTLESCDRASVQFLGDTGLKRMSLERLGDVTGSPCTDNTRQTSKNAITGSWYDPATSGQGFALQRVSAQRGIVYYYGFGDDGQPLWLLGTWEDGFSYGHELDIGLLRVDGGRYGGFDPADIAVRDWGRLRLKLRTCDAGEAVLDGEDGFQELALVRLAGSVGLDCVDP